MLKERLEKDKRVRLLREINPGHFFAYLIAGRIYIKDKEELLTDGKLKLLSSRSNQVMVEDYHWLVFIKEGKKIAEVDRDWLNNVNVCNKSFIDLCLSLGKRGVKKVKLISERAEIIKGHFTPVISDVFLGKKVPKGYYWLVIFNRDYPKCCQKIEVDEDSRYSLNWSVNIYRSKAFLVRFI